MTDTTSATTPVKKRGRASTAIALTAILLLGLFLRVADLSANPPGILVDEASIAYVARLVAQTGMDEKGARVPFYPQSTWNPKHPAYFYPSLAATKLLGLNRAAARSVSIFFGMIGILALYFLAQELFRDKRISLAAAFLLATSPWHVHFSRVAFEAVSMPAYFTLGLLFILKGLKRNPLKMIPGALLIAASFYAYPVALMFAPLLLAGAALIYRRQIATKILPASFAALIIAAAFIPAATRTFRSTGMDAYYNNSSVTGAAYQRQSQTLLSNSPNPLLRLASRTKQGRALYGFATNYLGYFSPRYLFLSGDNSSLNHGTMRHGVLLLITAPLLLLGLYKMFSSRTASSALVLWWLALYPAGASLMGWGFQHAIRSLIGVPAFQIITAAGLVALIDFTRVKSAANTSATKPSSVSNRKPALAAAAALLAISVNAASYFNYYFFQYPAAAAANYNYGFDIAFADAARALQSGSVKSVVLSEAIPYAYVYLFFYQPPQTSQIVRDPSTRAIDVKATARNMGFLICDIAKCLEQAPHPAIAIARPGQLPQGLYKNRYSNGSFYLKDYKLINHPGAPPNLAMSIVRSAP